MSVSALSVANYFLELSWRNEADITQMKLQKLIYFAHGWHLALFDTPLIYETVQAWKFGPVFESVYHEFKIFGKNPISKKMYDTYSKYSMLSPFKPLGNSDYEQIAKAIIEHVFSVYREYNAIDLMKLTHKDNAPWRQVVKSDKLDVRDSYLSIDNSIIQRYFKEELHVNSDD